MRTENCICEYTQLIYRSYIYDKVCISKNDKYNIIRKRYLCSFILYQNWIANIL